MLTALALVIHFEGGSCVGVQRRNKSSHNVGLVCVILSDSRDPRGGERQRTLPTSVHEGFSMAPSLEWGTPGQASGHSSNGLVPRESNTTSEAHTV